VVQGGNLDRFALPKKSVLVSIGSDAHKVKLLDSLRALAAAGFELYATEGSHRFLETTASSRSSRTKCRKARALQCHLYWQGCRLRAQYSKRTADEAH